MFKASQVACWTAVLVCLVARPGLAQPAGTDPKNAVVAITGTDGDGNTRVGVGFVVDASGTVVTTFRTLRGLVKASLRLANGDVHDISHVRMFDSAKNLALVQVSGFGLAAASLGDSETVSSGAKVSVLSAAGSGAASALPTTIGAVERLGDFRVFTLSPSVDLARAGAPILSADGKVVAMVAARPAAPTEAPIGLPINYVRGLVAHDEKLTLADLAQAASAATRTASAAASAPSAVSAATAPAPAPTPAATPVAARAPTAPPPSAAPSAAAPAAPAAAPAAGASGEATGTVVFYRIRRFQGSGLEPTILCNDKELADMDNGRYIKVALPPGPYVCRSTDKTVASFDLTANDTHYLKIEIVTGFMKGHGVIQEVPARQGEVEIRGLKPADTDNLRPGVKTIP